MDTEFLPKLPTPPKAPTHQTQVTYGEHKKTEHDLSDQSRPTGITQSTPATATQHDYTDITPESASAPHTADQGETCQQPSNTDGMTATPAAIPESVDESLQVETAAGHDEVDSPALPAKTSRSRT